MVCLIAVQTVRTPKPSVKPAASEASLKSLTEVAIAESESRSSAQFRLQSQARDVTMLKAQGETKLARTGSTAVEAYVDLRPVRPSVRSKEVGIFIHLMGQPPGSVTRRAAGPHPGEP